MSMFRRSQPLGYKTPNMNCYVKFMFFCRKIKTIIQQSVTIVYTTFQALNDYKKCILNKFQSWGNENWRIRQHLQKGQMLENWWLEHKVSEDITETDLECVYLFKWPLVLIVWNRKLNNYPIYRGICKKHQLTSR